MNQPRNNKGPKRAGIASAVVLAIAAPFVMQWEGLKTTTYIDVVGVPTVCYGDTGPHVTMGAVFTAEECAKLLDRRLTLYAQRLDKCVTVPVTPYQGAAILELAYNVGVGAVCNSTMVRQINAGAPPTQWCGQLRRWVYAGGRVWKGLVNRREDSLAMCMKG